MTSSSPFTSGYFGGCPLSSEEIALPACIVKKLFEGSKNLWRQRLFVDIIIFLHEKLPSVRTPSQSNYKPICIEIVAFNPTTGAEAPHLYLSFDKLESKLVKHGESQYEEAVSSTTVNKDVECHIVDYILNRIEATICSEIDGCISPRISQTPFTILLTPLEDDAGNPAIAEVDLPVSHVTHRLHRNCIFLIAHITKNRTCSFPWFDERLKTLK